MQITIKTTTLVAALSAVGIAANSRMTLPILGSVLITAKDGEVKLSATNLDIYTTETCAAEVQEPGQVVVAFKMLSLFVGRVGSSTVAFTLEGSRLSAKAGEMTAVFETLPPEEFPPLLAVENAQAEVTVKRDELTEPLRMVAHAMGTDESRYNLMGVCIKSAKRGTDFVATNGGLLALLRSDIPTADIEAILPADAVRALLRNVKGEEATLKLSTTAFVVTSGQSEIRGKLIEGMYPKYEQVIPKQNPQAFSANRKELLDAITTAALFLTLHEIDVSIASKGEKELEVSCHDRFRHTILGSDLEGQPTASIRFNHRFMKDTLAAIKDEFVRVELPTEGSNFGSVREGSFVGVVGLLASPSK